MRKKELLLFLALFLSYAYFSHPVPYDNVTSRMDLIYSALSDGKLWIDGYHENTDDKSLFMGHYYSDKAIGTSLLGMPVYAALKLLSRIAAFPVTELLSIYVVRVFTISLVSAFLGILLFRFLRNVTGEDSSFLLALGWGLATNAFAYSTTFYSHQLVSFLLFSAFHFVFRMKGKNVPAGRVLLCGFLCGYMVITEYPTFVLVPAVFLYLRSSVKERGWGPAFVIGFAVPLLLHAVYNYLCFGSPFALAYSHHVQPHRGTGIMGITGLSLKALFGILFSPSRGLFFLSPFLLLSLAGFARFYGRTELRKEFFFSVYLIVFYILMNASLIDWKAGWTLGPRHLVPILPFMVISIAFLEKRFYPARDILMLFSFLMVLFGTAINPHVPEVFSNPAREFLLPLLQNNYMADNPARLLGIKGIPSILPLVVVVAALIAVSGVKMSLSQKADILALSFALCAVLVIACSILFVRTRDTAAGCYYFGRVYEKNNMFGEAEKAFAEATVIKPDHTESYHRLGLMYEKTGMYDKAKAVYGKALAIDYNLAEVHNDLAVVLWKEGRFREAVDELKIALDLAPGYAQAKTNYESAVKALK